MLSKCLTLDKSGLGDWKLSKTIGKGQYSRVRLGTLRGGPDDGVWWASREEGLGCAVKVVRPRDPWMRAMALREVAALWRLRGHPHVARLWGASEARKGRYVYLFMRNYEGGTLEASLDNLSGPLSPHLTLSYMGQLISAVSWTHANGIAHRDIKTENILLSADGTSLALADFGLCAEWDVLKGHDVQHMHDQVPGPPSPADLRAHDAHAHRVLPAHDSRTCLSRSTSLSGIACESTAHESKSLKKNRRRRREWSCAGQRAHAIARTCREHKSKGDHAHVHEDVEGDWSMNDMMSSETHDDDEESIIRQLEESLAQVDTIDEHQVHQHELRRNRAAVRSYSAPPSVRTTSACGRDKAKAKCAREGPLHSLLWASPFSGGPLRPSGDPPGDPVAPSGVTSASKPFHNSSIRTRAHDTGTPCASSVSTTPLHSPLTHKTPSVAAPADTFAEAVGSPMYWAPELHRGAPGSARALDVWAIGVCFYQMLTGGRYPFEPFTGSFTSLSDLVRLHDIEIPPNASANAVDLLKRMLCKDVHKRITIEQMRRHPYLEPFYASLRCKDSSHASPLHSSVTDQLSHIMSRSAFTCSSEDGDDVCCDRTRRLVMETV